MDPNSLCAIGTERSAAMHAGARRRRLAMVVNATTKPSALRRSGDRLGRGRLRGPANTGVLREPLPRPAEATG